MSASTSTSIGLVIGKALGNTAAYAVHGAARAAAATGQFGADVAAGATAQYAVKSPELEARRAELLAKSKGVRSDLLDSLVMPVVATQRKAAVNKGRKVTA
jgi:hypothetical protein